MATRYSRAGWTADAERACGESRPGLTSRQARASREGGGLKSRGLGSGKGAPLGRQQREDSRQCPWGCEACLCADPPARGPVHSSVWGARAGGALFRKCCLHPGLRSWQFAQVTPNTHLYQEPPTSLAMAPARQQTTRDRPGAPEPMATTLSSWPTEPRGPQSQPTRLP